MSTFTKQNIFTMLIICSMKIRSILIYRFYCRCVYFQHAIHSAAIFTSHVRFDCHFSDWTYNLSIKNGRAPTQCGQQSFLRIENVKNSICEIVLVVHVDILDGFFFFLADWNNYIIFLWWNHQKNCSMLAVRFILHSIN